MSTTADAPAFPLDFETARSPRSDAAREVLDEAAAKKKDEGGIKGLALGKADTYQVSPFDIHVKPGWNTRDFTLPENQEHVMDLAHSIAAGGVHQPLTVYLEYGKLWLSDGECRLRGTLYAINVLGKPILSVPVRMEPRTANDADRVLSLLIRNSGKPLLPMEKAETIRRLLDFQWPLDRIAERTGWTLATVNRLADLLALPEAVRQQVATGAVAATEAVRVVREHGEAAPALIDAAVEASRANGGKRAGRATRASLRGVGSARDDLSEKLTLPALLAILKKAAPEAIEQKDGSFEICIPAADWERICAAF